MKTKRGMYDAPQAKLVDDARWPVQLDTNIGRENLSHDEAEQLYLELGICLIELELLRKTK